MRTRPEDTLVAFVEQEIGRISSWHDASWDHGESEVWRAVAENGGAAFLKVHTQARKFEQEVLAYERWAPVVGQTPSLLAKHKGRSRALLLSARAGSTALGAHLGSKAEERLYESAGRWLAKLHAVPHVDSDPLPIEAALERRAAAWANRASGVVDANDLRRIMAEVSHEWPRGNAPRTRVYCHRDFTARNWLVTPTGDLTVLDFEHSRADWHLIDIERVLSSIREDRPALRRSFERGYGPIPGLEILRRVSLVSALTRITWAREHGDAEFERMGREELAHLLM